MRAKARIDARLERVARLSRLAGQSDDPAPLAELQAVLWEPGFTLSQRQFFYWQRITRHARVNGAGLEPPQLYARLLDACREAVNIRVPWIPPGQRDPDAVVVITNQLLGLAHAPTADCLDYCRVLQARLKKKVLLVNTADMPWALDLPYHEPVRFNYVADYAAVSRLTFRGESFEFYQCRRPMPNVDEMRLIVAAVLARKPSFVFSLGHSNVTPDLCSDYLTVATMPFGTNLPPARSNVYVLPRAWRMDDDAVMRSWGVRREQIVEAPYTFTLPERSTTLSRAALGLPADAYVIAVVGNRLDEEITGTAAGELEQLLATVPAAFMAFLGTFPRYAAAVQRHPFLAARSTYLGHQKDVLAVYECCDAYWNPPRYGGGSSAAFALAMGLPVLTRATGDVANIAGPRFVFETQDEIIALVRRMSGDAGCRDEWTTAARARFAEVSDREAMLRLIVDGVSARADCRIARSESPSSPRSSDR